MRVFAVLAIALGTAMSAAPNTTGDSVMGALMVIGGLLGIFWPAARQRDTLTEE